MSPREVPDADDERGEPQGIGCPACQSALDSSGQESVSFMLLDGLTVPLVGCDTHLEQFTTACGLTSEETVDCLSHRPAGGISCPACQLAAHEPGYPMVPVGDGAVVVLGCPRHQTQTLSRFETGLRTQQRLGADFDSINSV